MSMYLLLFFTALGSATLLPFYSEILFYALLQKDYSPVGLWLAATLGNTLGAVVNWAIGWWLVDYADRRWFPFKERHVKRAQGWFNRYGTWTLLLSWMPVGGDALTFVAGMMRVRFPLFLLLVAIGKGVRYLILVLGVAGLGA